MVYLREKNLSVKFLITPSITQNCHHKPNEPIYRPNFDIFQNSTYKTNHCLLLFKNEP